MLETLVRKGYFSAVDLGIAKELLQDQFQECEAAAMLICYLSLSARCGHLCIEISDSKVIPDPISTWNEVCNGEGLLAELQQAAEMIVAGEKQLPARILTIVEEGKDSRQTPLYHFGRCIYFQRYWHFESSLLKYYQNFTALSPKIAFDQSIVNAKLNVLLSSNQLLPEQAQAILNACTHSLTILCGGPGTGKTYTAGLLISILWESLNEMQKERFEIALAAPTGKAAANLQKSLSNAAKGIKQLQGLQAKTIHALLGVRGPTSYSEIEPLAADLVIIDESSMIDARLMSALFQAMKPGARLVLLGDGHQLPPVESGSIFADLSSCIQQGTTYLKKCLRVELEVILEVAEAINQGDHEKTLEYFSKESEGIKRLKIEREKAAVDEICTFAFQGYGVQNLTSMAHEDLHKHFNQFRVLTPLRKGPFGVEEMNRLIANKVKASLRSEPFFIAPIMILKNDYRQELFNGETGVLIRDAKKKDDELSIGDYALFIGKNGKINTIPALLLPPFEYAYCLSVHKSQGSEFDHLLLLLPPGADCFGRELFYTAVTRARKKLFVWGDDETLKAIVQKTSRRQSGLAFRL